MIERPAFAPRSSSASFERPFCLKELRWAVQAHVPIQPILRVEDKQRIGEFLAQAPDDLKYLGGVDWIDLNRGDNEYWDLGVTKGILRDALTRNGELEAKNGELEGHIGELTRGATATKALLRDALARVEELEG